MIIQIDYKKKIGGLNLDYTIAKKYKKEKFKYQEYP